MRDPVIALDARCQLGESPVWDERRSELLWVDILRGQLRSWSPASGEQSRSHFDGELGAVILTETDEVRVLALDKRLQVERNGQLGAPLAEVERQSPDNRLNDCRSDPRGRIWAGTMSKVRARGEAALYRLRADGRPDRMVSGTTISNGIGWSPDRARMYFIDSLSYRLDVFDYDLASGEIAARRPLAAIDPADGLPDGLAIDAEGGVWVCLFGGGAIRRYLPDGGLDLEVDLPVTNPTCPTFGGEDLATIYVTSARHRLSAEQLGREELAGAIVSLRSEVPGMPANRAALPTTPSIPGRPPAHGR